MRDTLSGSQISPKASEGQQQHVPAALRLLIIFILPHVIITVLSNLKGRRFLLRL